jgi:hypothetical protein
MITVDLNPLPKDSMKQLGRVAIYTHQQVDIRSFDQELWELLRSRFQNAVVGGCFQ